MSAVQLTAASTTGGNSRWLLLGSLALNLFFVGIALAMAVRAPAAPSWDRNVFVRVERIAASLPMADGDVLRRQIKASTDAIEDAQSKYRAAQNGIHGVLRQEPFDSAALQAAMAKTRAARQNFDQSIHGIFLDAAAQMSPAGRRALADWPPGQKTAGNQQ
jgi:uncharacterized membrane protein